MDYSLADVVRMSGGKRRSFNYGQEAGAIRAFSRTDKRGTELIVGLVEKK